MKIKKILLPVDFSENNAAALAYASGLAATFEAELHIVHVDEAAHLVVVSEPEGFTYAAAQAGALREEMKSLLEKTQPTDPKVAFQRHLLQGVAAAEISGLAEREQVDLIVMSSHGRSGLSRLLMGSVAESVLRHAKCPVLILKQFAAEQGTELQA